MTSENNLDLFFVYESFKKSLKDEDDVLVNDYIDGYNELVKFLNMIGTVFSFVSSDVKSKIKVMEEHKISPNSANYASFKQMMKYEKEQKLHTKSGFVSGSRTMLRLHRGLDFIREFLKQLGNENNETSTSSVAQNTYNSTLAAFHPWYIRTAASLAMIALPSRSELLKKLFGTEEELNSALEILPQTLDSCDEVYNRVHKLYTEFDFHGLP